MNNLTENPRTPLPESELGVQRRLLTKVLMDINFGDPYEINKSLAVDDKIVVLGEDEESAFTCHFRYMNRYGIPYFRLKVSDYFSRESGDKRVVLVVTSDGKDSFDLFAEHEEYHNHKVTKELPQEERIPFMQKILGSNLNDELTQQERKSLVRIRDRLRTSQSVS